MTGGALTFRHDLFLYSIHTAFSCDRLQIICLYTYHKLSEARRAHLKYIVVQVYHRIRKRREKAVIECDNGLLFLWSKCIASYFNVSKYGGNFLSLTGGEFLRNFFSMSGIKR